MDQNKPQHTSAARDAHAAESAMPGSAWRGWRILVILVIVTIFGWEGLAFYGYQSSSQRISQAMTREGGKPTLEEATAMIQGFPQRSSEEAYSRPTLTYRWRGLFMEYGGVRLSVDPGTDVVEVFEMSIPTREEEARMQMEYEPIPGATTTSPMGPAPENAPAPSSVPAEEADPEAAIEEAPPADGDESDGE